MQTSRQTKHSHASDDREHSRWEMPKTHYAAKPDAACCEDKHSTLRWPTHRIAPIAQLYNPCRLYPFLKRKAVLWASRASIPARIGQ